jgi:hypothetical protein
MHFLLPYPFFHAAYDKVSFDCFIKFISLF